MNTHHALRFTLFWVLVFLTLLNAVSAVAGGIAMLVTGGLGMPYEFLASGPFRSFTVPGLVLVLVVGGTQALALGLLLARRESALLWTAVAGFGMVIWIAVEMAVVDAGSWLQTIFLVTGIVQLVIVLALLGVVRWLPRASLADASHPAR
ncbi:hypothetical protein ABCS02_21415 [Microbacterium sp. X-17]|uniref:hypothetical protein n=1 Tax=Microbacterium sp. X-17 TaxID=3144404 RepID=UPI0031F5142E